MSHRTSMKLLEQIAELEGRSHRRQSKVDDEDEDDDDVAVDPESDYDAVLVDRVAAALKWEQGVVKIFLGGTQAANLPLNLYKLRGKVRELFVDSSPRLKTISQDIGALSSTLTRLDASNCAIESLPDELGAMTSLQFLVLRGNRLTSFVWDCPGLDQLLELDLSGNRIRYFSPQVCDKILSRAQPGLNPVMFDNAGGGGGNSQLSPAGAQKQQLHRMALVASRRIFIDMWGNEQYFIKVADRGKDDLQRFVPESSASLTCAICQTTSFTRMPHVAARFIDIGSPSTDYDTAKMTRTSPLVKFLPILYPTCSADCTLALQTAAAWMHSLSQDL